MTVNPVRMPLSLLIDDRLEDWKNWLAASGQCLEVIAPDEPAIGEYDPARLAQGLDAFVAWRGDVRESGGIGLPPMGADAGYFQFDWTESSDEGRDPSDGRPDPHESLALAAPGSHGDRHTRGRWTSASRTVSAYGFDGPSTFVVSSECPHVEHQFARVPRLRADREPVRTARR